jgi:predicted dinucleotide-binding enzyme
VVESLGPGIANKVVVDATNPLSGFPELEVLWNGTSGTGVVLPCRPRASAAVFDSQHAYDTVTACKQQCCLRAVMCRAVTGGELLSAALPDSFVFKAFNTLGTSVTC